MESPLGGDAAATFTAVFLTQDELEVAAQFGPVRLLAMFGNRYRLFPTAPWVDRERSALVSVETMKGSLVGRVGRVSSTARVFLRGIETKRETQPPTGTLENAAVTLARREVVCEISTEEAAHIAKALDRARAENIVVAFVATPDERADACFCWLPGAPQAYAITGPANTGAHISGNYLLIAAGQPADRVEIVEDGFGLLLTNGTWDELRGRLGGGGENWGMPFSGELGFRLKVRAT